MFLLYIDFFVVTEKSVIPDELLRRWGTTLSKVSLQTGSQRGHKKIGEQSERMSTKLKYLETETIGEGFTGILFLGYWKCFWLRSTVDDPILLCLIKGVLPLKK